MSLRPKRRKCRCCREFFFPDYRNAERQHYCGKPACRQARKRANQRRWRRTPFGRSYFRSAENARRVRQWRQAHPGYWKRKTPMTTKFGWISIGFEILDEGFDGFGAGEIADEPFQGARHSL